MLAILIKIFTSVIGANWKRRNPLIEIFLKNLGNGRYALTYHLHQVTSENTLEFDASKSVVWGRGVQTIAKIFLDVEESLPQSVIEPA